MFKNVLNLTKILSKDLLSKLDFINNDNKKVNKKSTIFFILLFVLISLSFLSYRIIYYLKMINQAPIFLNIYWMIIAIIVTFQVLLISINYFYFSHEINYLLPLPIRPKELLTAKFLTIVFNMYITEFVFVLFPMIIYGIMTYCNLLYFIYLFSILVIFPILPVVVISIIISILIKFSRFVKNKNIFQLLIVCAFIVCVFFIETKILSYVKMENSGEINNELIENYIVNFNTQIKKGNVFFLQVNDIVTMLEKPKLIEILRLIKILCMDTLFFIIFTALGNKYYIKDILKNNNYNAINKIKKIKYIKQPKKQYKIVAYLKKEIKMLVRNSTFFIQSVFPTIILIFTIVLFTIEFVPSIRVFLESELLDGDIQFNYNLKMAGAILFLVQIVFTMSNISLTGISREGKNAKFMKNFPMKLYDQFTCKALIQTLINNVVIIAFIFFIHKIIHEIPLLDLLFIFMLSFLLNIINSKLMLFIDLVNPNLNWDSEYEINKNNKNKIFQYGFAIGIILFITYLVKILNNTNLIMAYLVFIDCFILIIFIINLIVKLNIKRLFDKIDH